MKKLFKKRKSGKGKLFLAVSPILLTSLVLFGFNSAGAQGGQLFETMERGHKVVSLLSEKEMIYQYPEMPNGCEATSLTISLNQLGYDADKLEIAYNYVPREDFAEDIYGYTAPDPNEKYAGDPATSMGFYCLPGAIVKGANYYLQDFGSSRKAIDVTGIKTEEIKRYLDTGTSVIAWATIDYSDTAQYHSNFSWYFTDSDYSEEYIPYNNLHCVVITGYSEGLFYIADPIEGLLEMDEEIFINSFEALGRMAVVLTK